MILGTQSSPFNVLCKPRASGDDPLNFLSTRFNGGKPRASGDDPNIGANNLHTAT